MSLSRQMTSTIQFNGRVRQRYQHQCPDNRDARIIDVFLQTLGNNPQESFHRGYAVPGEPLFYLEEGDLVILDCNEPTQVVYNEQTVLGYKIDTIRCYPNFDMKMLLQKCFKSKTLSEIQDMVESIYLFVSGFLGRDASKVDQEIERMASSLDTAEYNELEILELSVYLYTTSKSSFSLKEEEKQSLIARSRTFLIWWKHETRRNLYLLGFSDCEIETLPVTYAEAVEICRTNPLRLPNLLESSAKRIFGQYLQRTPTPEEKLCGEIARLVYTNFKEHKWTSTPRSLLVTRYPDFDRVTKRLEDYFISPFKAGSDQEPVITPFSYDHWYYVPVRDKEKFIAYRIHNLLEAGPIKKNVKPVLLEGLNDLQRQGVTAAFTQGISMILGEGGTGKTQTLVSCILTAIQYEIPIAILAFTGKAVARVRQQVCAFNRDLLSSQFISLMTIDMAILRNPKMHIAFFEEASMISSALFYRLLEVFKNFRFRMVFIGDPVQLPPIDWGEVMGQLIQTNIPRVKLLYNYRSEANILEVLRLIRDDSRRQEGIPIAWENFVDNKHFFYYIGGKTLVEEIVRTLVASGYPKEGISCITPYNADMRDLNVVLQPIFIPEPEATVHDGDKEFRLGDRVMMLQNNYDIGVMNGHEGRVVKICHDYILIEFESGIFPFILKNWKTTLQKDLKNFKYKVDNLDLTRCHEAIKEMNVPTRLTLQEYYRSPPMGRLLSIECEARGYVAQMSNRDNQDICGLLSQDKSSFPSTKDIIHSYCMTVHKSQGSEYTYCLVYVPSRDFGSIHRRISGYLNYRLIYTAASRAKQLLILVTESPLTLTQGVITNACNVHDNLGNHINFLQTGTWTSVQEAADFGGEDYQDFQDYQEVEYYDD